MSPSYLCKEWMRHNPLYLSQGWLVNDIISVIKSMDHGQLYFIAGLAGWSSLPYLFPIWVDHR